MSNSRIKEYVFNYNVSGTHTGSFVSSYNLNGEILEVSYTYGSQGATGSLWTTFATTQETFWQDNTASGAGWQVMRPGFLRQSTTGSAAGGTLVPFVTNDLIVLNTGSILSGATALQVHVLYR